MKPARLQEDPSLRLPCGSQRQQRGAPCPCTTAQPRAHAPGNPTLPHAARQVKAGGCLQRLPLMSLHCHSIMPTCPKASSPERHNQALGISGTEALGPGPVQVRGFAESGGNEVIGVSTYYQATPTLNVKDSCQAGKLSSAPNGRNRCTEQDKKQRPADNCASGESLRRLQRQTRIVGDLLMLPPRTSPARGVCSLQSPRPP